MPHYNAYRERVIPHQLNHFDFDKPLKFYVGETEEEEEDEDEDKDECLYNDEDNNIINSNTLYIDDKMSNNSWVNHVREFAKQHNLTYMCAASTPECSKSYKEKQKPKAITAPASAAASAPVVAKAVAKTVAPKTGSGNTFKLIDKSYIPKSKPPLYMYINRLTFGYTKLLRLEHHPMVLYIILLKHIIEHQLKLSPIKIM